MLRYAAVLETPNTMGRDKGKNGVEEALRTVRAKVGSGSEAGTTRRAKELQAACDALASARDAQVQADGGRGRGRETEVLEAARTVKDAYEEHTRARDVEDLRTRTEEIRRLEQGVAEVGQLMQELGVLVQNQQDIVNNVEYDIEATRDNVEHADEQLVQVHAHKKRRRKWIRRMWMCIVLVVIVAVLVIVLALQPWK